VAAPVQAAKVAPVILVLVQLQVVVPAVYGIQQPQDDPVDQVVVVEILVVDLVIDIEYPVAQE
jgi:hypothetical protein